MDMCFLLNGGHDVGHNFPLYVTNAASSGQCFLHNAVYLDTTKLFLFLGIAEIHAFFSSSFLGSLYMETYERLVEFFVSL